jgi:hypothetical protein
VSSVVIDGEIVADSTCLPPRLLRSHAPGRLLLMVEKSAMESAFARDFLKKLMEQNHPTKLPIAALSVLQEI